MPPAAGVRLHMWCARGPGAAGSTPAYSQAQQGYTSTVTSYLYNRGIGIPVRVGQGRKAVRFLLTAFHSVSKKLRRICRFSGK